MRHHCYRFIDYKFVRIVRIMCIFTRNHRSEWKENEIIECSLNEKNNFERLIRATTATFHVGRIETINSKLEEQKIHRQTLTKTENNNRNDGWKGRGIFVPTTCLPILSIFRNVSKTIILWFIFCPLVLTRLLHHLHAIIMNDWEYSFTQSPALSRLHCYWIA